MTMADVAEPRNGDVPRDDGPADEAPANRTKTTMTMTLVADGFVGQRQVQAAAQNAARQLRGVVPYDVRVEEVGSTFTDASGTEYTDLASASDLPVAEASRLPVATPPTPLPPPAPVAPLHAEKVRGGLPDANLADVDELPAAVPGIGGVVGGAGAATVPPPAEQTAGGAGRAEAGAAPPEDVAYEDMTVAELRTRATELGIEGRSGMNKAELIEAIEEAEG